MVWRFHDDGFAFYGAPLVSQRPICGQRRGPGEPWPCVCFADHDGPHEDSLGEEWDDGPHESEDGEQWEDE
jgi:hypothetical protein